MCGEHVSISGVKPARTGSSPHVRGAPPYGSSATRDDGIIPACAGSTMDFITTTLINGDHPRMCGEHDIDPRQRYFTTGIIPACAGSTSPLLLHKRMHRDHPRMCGEHTNRDMYRELAVGSSPHVRGARLRIPQRGHGHGIIPACAGSTQ